MKVIVDVVLTPEVIDHIWQGHQVTSCEVEEVCYGEIRFRRARSGRAAVFGQSDAGRYLLVFGILMPKQSLFVITARDMEDHERRYYLRRGK